MPQIKKDCCLTKSCLLFHDLGAKKGDSPAATPARAAKYNDQAVKKAVDQIAR